MPEANSEVFDFEERTFTAFASRLIEINDSAPTSGKWAIQAGEAITGALNTRAKDATEIELRTFASQVLSWAQDVTLERWLVDESYATLVRDILLELGRQADNWFQGRGWRKLDFQFSLEGDPQERFFKKAATLDHTGTIAELYKSGELHRLAQQAAAPDQEAEELPEPQDTGPPKTSKRRGRPAIDPAHHQKLFEIVDACGGRDALADDNTLDRVCKRLDRTGVPCPREWLRDDPPVRSWKRQFDYEPDRVRKVIVERYRKFNRGAHN